MNSQESAQGESNSSLEDSLISNAPSNNQKVIQMLQAPSPEEHARCCCLLKLKEMLEMMHSSTMKKEELLDAIKAI